jgi:hypothetical protein
MSIFVEDFFGLGKLVVITSKGRFDEEKGEGEEKGEDHDWPPADLST